MAFGKIYELTGCDIDGDLTTVEIWLEDYSGIVKERDLGADGPIFDYGDQSADGLANIYGSSCEFSFIALSDREAIELYTADAQGVKVLVFKGATNTPKWSGFLDSEKYTEPIQSPPFEVSLTAYDGLGLLKDVEPVSKSGDILTYEYDKIQYLSLILAQTGLELNINVALAIRKSTALEANGFHETTWASLFADEEKNSYEVLQLLFPTCRIMQRENEWFIFDHILIAAQATAATTSLTFKQYDSDGVYVQEVVKDLNATGWYIQGLAEMTFNAALKQIVLSNDYGYIENILTNGDFEDDTNSWTFEGSGIGGSVKIYNTDQDKGLLLQGYTSSVPTEGVYQNVYFPETDKLLQLKFKYCTISNSANNPSAVYIKILTTIDGVTYHAQKSANGDYEFSAGNTALQINDSIDDCTLFEIDDNLQSKTIVIKDMPGAGTYQFYFLIPKTDYYVTLGAFYSDIQLSLVDQDDPIYKTEELTTTVNSANNDEVEKDIVGDVPDLLGAEKIYKGGIKDQYDEYVTAWVTASTDTAVSLSRIIGQIIASHRRRPQQAYDIALANLSFDMKMIMIDPDNGDTKFIENGATYNDRTKVWEGRYIEILEKDLTAAESYSLEQMS